MEGEKERDERVREGNIEVKGMREKMRDGD